MGAYCQASRKGRFDVYTLPSRLTLCQRMCSASDYLLLVCDSGETLMIQCNAEMDRRQLLYRNSCMA